MNSGIFTYGKLNVAIGGTEERHMITSARSKDPYGPWEPCPWNPLLHHYKLSVEGSNIRCTGNVYSCCL